MLTKKLNEGVATAIADSDLVTVCDAQGATKPISFENFMKAVRDNVKVGGRNLLKNTDCTITNIPQSPWDYSWWAAYASLNDGEVCTFSVSCKDDLSGVTAIIQNGGTHHLVGVLKKVGLNRYAMSAVWAGGASSAFTVVIQSTGKQISRMKLERGNIATDWTPAPEDIASGACGGGNWLLRNQLQFDKERRCA